jgi:CubicO group peptidase (beta-lactamase class C family)
MSEPDAFQAFDPDPRVDGIFEEWDSVVSPGCSVAVSKGGEMVYSRGYGMADLDHGICNTPGTVFHAASLAKQFTAMSILLLVAQGVIKLTDEVQTHLPELAPLRNAVGKPITIEQMLHHISGIRDQWVLATLAGWRMSDDVISLDDVLWLVGRMQTLNFDPGTAFSYSNTNYTLAGLIVARKNLCGQSLAEFAQANIFKPLRMTSTRFTDRHGEIVKDRAYGYRGKRRGAFDKPPFEIRMANYDLTGPTNLLTTVEDLIRWAHNLDPASNGVGGANAIAQMEAPLPVSRGYGLGLMMSKDPQGRPIVEHDGADAGYRSHLILYPAEGVAVALLFNSWLPGGKTFDLVRKVAAIFLPAKPVVSQPESQVESQTGPGELATASGDLAEYVGRYHSDEIESTYEVKLTGGSLRMERPRYGSQALTATTPDKFTADLSGDVSGVLPAVSVAFKRDAKGSVNGFCLDDVTRAPRLMNFRFCRLT